MDDEPFRPPVQPTRAPRRGRNPWLWAIIVFLLLLLAAVAGVGYYIADIAWRLSG